MLISRGSDGVGAVTQTAGTRIQQVLGGQGGSYTNLVKIRYTAGSTAHTGTIMRGQSRTTVNGAIAAGGTSIVVKAALLKSDGATAPSSGDLIGVRLANGQWFISTISAYNAGTLTYTLNTAIPTGQSVPSGAKFALFGVAADSYHANYTFALGASTSTEVPTAGDPAFAVVKASAPSEPLVFDSNNATNAGTLNSASVEYTMR